MRREVKRLRNYMGRVIRDLARQLPYGQQSERLQMLYHQALKLQLLTLNPKAKNKLYSLHEPDIVCIAKGKTRTPL